MSSTAPVSDLAPVALVGAGALGTVLARRLVSCGYPLRAVFSSDPADAQALADRVGAPVASDTFSALPADVRLVLLCVPDDALPSVAQRLADVDHSWAATDVAHTSGLRPAGVLAPLAEEGGAVFSFHPLQTFTRTTPPEAFEGIVVGVEGPEEGVSVGRALAETIGAKPVVLDAEAKERYHCAAALASNGFVALMGVVQDVLSTATLETSDPADLFAPLIEQTWAHLKEDGPKGALTGPVARGDQATVEAHLETLSAATPHLVPLYTALSKEMVRLAERRGALDVETAETLLETLQNPPSPPN